MFISVFFNCISEKVLQDQSDANMWSNSGIECRVSDPHACESFVFDCLSHSIKDAFVWENSLSIRFHFLNFCFGIVKR